MLTPRFLAVGALGYESAAEISGRDIIRRTPEHGLRNFEELYPWTTLAPGSLLDRTAPAIMQVRYAEAVHEATAHPLLRFCCTVQEIWDNKNSHHQMLWERA